MRVLVVNAGSSTLKVQIVGSDDDIEADASLDRWDGSIDATALRRLLGGAEEVDAVGHRFVHGGRDLTAATVITPDVEATIEGLTSLAPLHQPRALAALAAARAVRPDVPHVSCFDTAFHSSMPAESRTYALPRGWRERWDLDRFGFHGLSHAWAARRGPLIAGVDPRARIITCHLGAGASLCAVVGGRSMDTTMGFTPLDGLVMATRAGAVDPGLILWLITDGGLTATEVADGMQRHAGLAGLAGTADMRELLERRSDGEEGALLAFDVYVHRLSQAIAAMAVSAGGVDLLVFTGGVGEHAAPVRAAATERLAMLDIEIDASANAAASGDVDVTGAGARARTAVVVSREGLEIARQVRELLEDSR